MKTEFLANISGDDIPADTACLPVSDLGVAQGIAVTEMMRTFNHQIFRLDDHLERLKHSLDVVGWPEIVPKLTEISETAQRIVEHNSSLIDQDDDLGVNIFVTGGPNPSYLGQQTSAPSERTIGIHTFPLRFERWANCYSEGVRLTVSSVKAMPGNVIDPTMKYRSRLHWYLADQEVANRAPGNRAILVDQTGNLTETSTGNFFAVIEDTIVTPPDDMVLPGISRQVVSELAVQLGINFERQELSAADVQNASEAFLSSTPYCLLPVSEFNGKPVGYGTPGLTFKQLLELWSQLVNVNIVKQAVRHPLR